MSASDNSWSTAVHGERGSDKYFGENLKNLQQFLSRLFN